VCALVSNSTRATYLPNTILVNLPSILTRLATFAAFAIVAKIKGSNSINTSLVITSLAILDLLGNPLSELLYAIPQAYAALGCFQRIQEFLLMEDRSEQRQIGSEQFITAVGARGHDQTGADIELASLHGYRRSISNSLLDTIEVRRGEFGWSELRTPTINGVDLHLRKDVLLTIVVGSVGCGKSTFLKGLLGETPVFGGSVHVETPEIAFCDQSPWIANASIRENIVGESMFDDAWYNQVVWACALVCSYRTI
jgi:ATP-binding cassette subfamily C (CFTR/MRP) protein 1